MMNGQTIKKKIENVEEKTYEKANIKEFNIDEIINNNIFVEYLSTFKVYVIVKKRKFIMHLMMNFFAS